MSYKIKLFWENRKLMYKSVLVKPNSKATKTMRVNPLPGMFHRIKVKLMLFKLWYKKEQYKRCQGCGEGISMHRIRDPNYKQGNKWFNCCDGCVNFYDWRWSARRIIGWKNKKQICKLRV